MYYLNAFFEALHFGPAEYFLLGGACGCLLVALLSSGHGEEK